MSLRDDASSIYASCIKSLNPSTRVYDYLEASTLFEKKYNSIYLVSLGKASIGMMSGALKYLSKKNLQDKIKDKPIIVSNHGNLDAIYNINVSTIISSHPIPSNLSVSAATEAINYVSNAAEKDLVLVLISGGASALFCKPNKMISLEDKIKITNVLLKCGADINEINTIRKHISDVKGGRFASFCSPADCHSLVISDVINDDLSTIASGITSPDNTTFDDCIKIIKKYKINEEIPSSIQNHFSRGCNNIDMETPIELNNVSNNIICSNRIFRNEIGTSAKQYGYKPIIPNIDLIKEAVIEGKNLVELVNETLNKESTEKIAIITGGETVVNLTGDGLGGRNQELSLAFLDNIHGEVKNSKWAMLSVGTDGIDGPTDAAGALIDNDAYTKLNDENLDVKDYLVNNDSYNLLRKINALYITGPSGNNVADIQITLVDKLI